MSKKLKLGSSAPASCIQPTDWEVCVLCQENSHDVIVDPSNARNVSQPKGYTTLAENLQSLHDLDALPLCINISRLGDGHGIAETLCRHKAKWHKTCYVMCNQTKVERAKKRKAKSQMLELPNTPIKSKLRASFTTSTMTGETDRTQSSTCFFCDQTVDRDAHTAATANLDENVRKIATELRDSTLLAKLSSGDMTALDAIYHKRCLTKLYTRYRSYIRVKESTGNSEYIRPDSIALAELISHIEEFAGSDDGMHHIFKLSDLVKLYTNRLEQLGGNLSTRVNSTRLKEKLIEKIPTLEANQSKYGVILSFKSGVGDVLLHATDKDSDSDAIVLMRAAQIVRKDILQMHYKFNGSLVDDSYDINPASLIALVNMILAGTNINTDTEDNNILSSVILSLTQLLVLHTMKRSRKDRQSIRHNLDRETLLPLYLGILVHNKTRKRDLVDTLFERGVSVSYDRILQLSTETANKVIDLFEQDGVVCPTVLRDGVYTTGNLDNIDHNPSSTSSQDSFHGTALSLTQHPSSEDNGTLRTHNIVESSDVTPKLKTIKPLPDTYMHVPPAVFPNDNPSPTISEDLVIPETTLIDSDETQQMWLVKVHEHIHEQNDQPDSDTNISWSAHFASLQDHVPRPPAITGLLPLFRDSAHSLAMVKHGMNIIRNATQLVHPGQCPVLTVDQPLYAIAKRIQWSWSNEYGEDKYVLELFSRMYISCQSRDGDLDNFFQHAWPPSLAENNMIRHNNKSDLLVCLEALAPRPQEIPQIDMRIIDGSALVHTLDPKRSNTLVKTFDDYAHDVFIPPLQAAAIFQTPGRCMGSLYT